MTEHAGRDATALGLRRRGLLAYSIAMLMSSTMVLTATTAGYAQSVDLSKWSPEYIKSIAGTEEVDTAADCSKVVPLDYKGKVSVW